MVDTFLTAMEAGERLEATGLVEGPLDFRVYAPGFRDVNRSTTLRAGLNTITVELSPALRLEGTLVSRNDVRLEALTVTAPTGESSVTVGGEFVLDVEPGASTVELRVSREGRVLTTHRVPLPPPRPLLLTLPWDAVQLKVLQGRPTFTHLPFLPLRVAERPGSVLRCGLLFGRCTVLLGADVQPGVPYEVLPFDGIAFTPARVTLTGNEPVVLLGRVAPDR